MKGTLKGLALLGAGFGLGILFAPRRGSWYRNQAKQRLTHVWRRGAVSARRRTHDIRNRVRGAVHELAEPFMNEQHEFDEKTLTDRVRTALGRDRAAPMDRINVNAVGHTIYLHGSATREELEDLVERIRGIEGVEQVDASYLQIRAA
jgi:hypothetical protein